MLTTFKRLCHVYPSICQTCSTLTGTLRLGALLWRNNSLTCRLSTAWSKLVGQKHLYFLYFYNYYNLNIKVAWIGGQTLAHVNHCFPSWRLVMETVSSILRLLVVISFSWWRFISDVLSMFYEICGFLWQECGVFMTTTFFFARSCPTTCRVVQQTAQFVAGGVGSRL